MAPIPTDARSPEPERLGYRPGDWVALAVAAVVAIGLGWIVASLDGFAPDVGSALALTLGALAALAVIVAGPMACVVGIVAATFIGYGTSLGQLGSLEITPADAFYVGLVGWWLLAVIGRAQRERPDDRPRIAFGQTAAILFFGYTALTFLHLASTDPGALELSLVSWIKFVQTASIAFMAASLIETKREIKVILGAIALSGAVAVAIAAITGGSILGARSGGAVGPQPTGLLSGMMLLIAAFGAVTTNRAFRIALASVGLFGMLIAKSVGSLVATGFALAVGAALTARASAAQRATRAVVAVGVAAVLVFGIVQVFRPEVTPGSEDFRNSSASHRLIVATAGLEIFERNPVIGAGWRQSSNPNVIGDREVARAVRRRVPGGRPIHYPDVTPTSVHNTYIQVLADLGLVGFVLFAAMIVAVALRAVALLRRLGPGDDLWREAWVMSLGLLLLLVWLNDHPLFGGQPETVLGAVLVGTLAATSRIVGAPRRGPAPATAVR